MTVPSSVRRGATLSAAVLVGTLLPVLALPAAQADPGCTSEAAPPGELPLPLPLPSPLGPGDRCDDSEAPVTSSVTAAPAANAAGFIAQDSVTFTFTGAHTDADADPIAFECQFFNTPEPPAEDDWTPCTSPQTYPDLEDTRRQLGGVETPYTFRVRAYDAADRGIDATAPTNLLLGTGGAETDLPDTDQTPEQTSFKVDTQRPVASIFNTPFDRETPERPMITTDSPTLRINGNEPALVFDCDIDGREVPCRDDNVTFTDLGPGTQTLSVSVTDRAGNTSAAPATTSFTVPEDLVAPGRRWRTRASRQAFGGDYLEASAYKTKITVAGVDVREVRLLANTGPKSGKLKYKTPGGAWRKVKLGGKTTKRGQVVIVRNEQSAPFTGKIAFRVMSRGKPVQLDAIMLR
jgi:hypothetical protein